jgi:FixJ family two-component response regulator
MIYLIDADNSVLRALELFIESAGMECRSFQSTTSFLSAVKPSPSDLIVLDLSKPGLIACDLLKKFRHDVQSTPILVLTVFDDDHFRECCRQHGVISIMRKPVDGESLIDLIKYSICL